MTENQIEMRYSLLNKNSAGKKKFFFVKLLFRIGLEIRFQTVSDFVGMACRADYLLLLVAGREGYHGVPGQPIQLLRCRSAPTNFSLLSTELGARRYDFLTKF